MSGGILFRRGGLRYRGLTKFQAAPGGLESRHVNAVVVWLLRFALVVLTLLLAFAAIPALGLFHLADGFGLLDGGGSGEGAGLEAGCEVFVDAGAAAHGLVFAFGVEEFGEEFEVEGVVVAEVLEDGPSVGGHHFVSFGKYLTSAFITSPGRVCKGLVSLGAGRKSVHSKTSAKRC